MNSPFTHFSSIWIVVVAVDAVSGERSAPLALAAKDVGTGCLIEIGVPKLLGIRHPPYPTGPQALLVTIDAHEVVACHLALGWRVPERIVDLHGRVPQHHERQACAGRRACRRTALVRSARRQRAHRRQRRRSRCASGLKPWPSCSTPCWPRSTSAGRCCAAAICALWPGSRPLAFLSIKCAIEQLSLRLAGRQGRGRRDRRSGLRRLSRPAARRERFRRLARPPRHRLARARQQASSISATTPSVRWRARIPRCGR